MLGDGVDLLFCNLAEAQEWTGAQRLEDAARATAQGGAILRDHAGRRAARWSSTAATTTASRRTR